MKRYYRNKYIQGSFSILNDSNGCGLLSRSGTLYNGLPYKDGVSIHPPVTTSNQQEFGLLIEWLMQNRLYMGKVQYYNLMWMELNIITCWLNDGKVPSVDVVSDMAEMPVPQSFIDSISRQWSNATEDELEDEEDRLTAAVEKAQDDIASWYVQNFIRVRAGGMYSYRQSDSIYFRISSNGFDWTPIIKRFCEDAFGVDSTQQIWVGLDEDNRASNRRYFEGTVKDLLFDNLESEVWASDNHKPVSCFRSKRPWR